MREKVSILPTSVYLSKMHDAGWSLVALEWEREVETHAPPDRRSPARALRRSVGIPQETVVPRHLELLTTVDRDPPPAMRAARTPWRRSVKTAQAMVRKVARSIGLAPTSIAVGDGKSGD